jgi:hypothetical protein
MQYKTITLVLIEENPELHERLRQSRTLHSTMEKLAIQLKENHEMWKETLRRSKPNSDPSQIASEALEFACKELEEVLASASPQSETEVLSLDEAMSLLRRHTPPA